ncbi:MAG: response regulator transcription factor [Deinococcales bacterium]
MGLSILIADDHPLFRMGLRYALEAAGFQIIGEAASGAEAIQKSQALIPQVLLLDIKMPEGDGIEVTRQLRKSFNSEALIIILLSTFEEEAILHAAREAGASAFFSKETDPKTLAEAIRKISQDPQKDWLPQVDLPELSSRELEVLYLLAEGQSNKAIAQNIGLSPETIKSHITNLYLKLEVNDRVSAVKRASELGLLRL